MNFTLIEGTGRAVCEEDPDLWVHFFFNNPRTDQPARLILSIDRRMIGFASFRRNEEAMRDVGTDVSKYTVRVIGMGTYGNARPFEPRLLRTNASEFASREQQQRAIAAFTAGVREIFKSKFKRDIDVVFSPEIAQKLEFGDFIEA